MEIWCIPIDLRRIQTYLGQTKLTRETRIKAEEKFPITGQGYILGKLLDGSECQILLDTGASKIIYVKSISLMMQKFTCTAQICF